MQALGIDIGGSGIKGARVDLEKGELTGERLRFDTPQPATPQAVADVVAQLVKQMSWSGPIGCTFPAVVRHGVTMTAANVDKSWIGTNAQALFEQMTGLPVRLLNDADAAGLAEMTYGAGKERTGTVILLTFGTGIGSAIFLDGKLLPNSEFGHVPMPMRGIIGEHYCSARVRKEQDLKWEVWTKRVNHYLELLDLLLSPDLFIVGGGISKKYEKFLPLLKTRARDYPGATAQRRRHHRRGHGRARSGGLTSRLSARNLDQSQSENTCATFPESARFRECQTQSHLANDIDVHDPTSGAMLTAPTTMKTAMSALATRHSPLATRYFHIKTATAARSPRTTPRRHRR